MKELEPPPMTETEEPKKPPQARAWEAILYPDCPADEEALRYMIQTPCVAYILHDSDKHDDGTPKKPHYHLIKVFNSATTIGGMERMMPNVHSNQFQKVQNLEKALLYLTHYNNPEKAQYKREQIVTSMPDKVNRVYQNVGDIASALIDVLDFIEDQYVLEWYTLADVVRWCANNGYYGVMRQNSALISQIVRQKICTEQEISRDLDFGRRLENEATDTAWTVIKCLNKAGIVPSGGELQKRICANLFDENGKFNKSERKIRFHV